VVERKPAGTSWESFVDRQIREAQERGEFDELPGRGEPIADLSRHRDDLWWVRRKLKDEGLSYVPPSLQLKKEAEDLLDHLAEVPTESVLRETVRDLNARIREANRTVLSGPPTVTRPLDEEATVAAWHRARDERYGAD
jgi:hypothetical protein